MRRDPRSMLLGLYLVLFAPGPARFDALVATSTALAEPPASFQRTIKEAVVLFEAGRFPEARAAFLEAHALAPSARTLRALGMVEFELQHYTESVQYLEQALASRTKPLDEMLRREAKSVLVRAQKNTARVRFVLSPREANLLVDGIPVLPDDSQGITLNPGQHAIELRAEGRQEQRTQLTLSAGEERSVTLALAPTLESPNAVATHSERNLYKNPWLWSGVGLVVVGVVTGLAVGLGQHDHEQPEKASGGDTGAVLTGP